MFYNLSCKITPFRKAAKSLKKKYRCFEFFWIFEAFFCHWKKIYFKELLSVLAYTRTWLCCKSSHALPTTLRFLIDSDAHLYDFKSNIHVFSVLAEFELGISAHLSKLKSPFQLPIFFKSTLQKLHSFSKSSEILRWAPLIKRSERLWSQCPNYVWCQCPRKMGKKDPKCI